MAKNSDDEITGFFLGGVVPLEMVGHVMAALYKGHAADMQVAPHITTNAPTKRVKRLADVAGIAGLLPSPHSGSQNRDRAVQEILLAAGEAGMKKIDITKQLVERGFPPTVLDAAEMTNLAKAEKVKRLSLGVYALGPRTDVTASVGAAPSDAGSAEAPNPAEAKGKRQLILDFLRQRGEDGAGRDEIIEMLGQKGYSAHFDAKLMSELLESNSVTRLARGLYAIGDAEPPPTPPRALHGTLPEAVETYLREAGKPVDVRVATREVAEAKGVRASSIRNAIVRLIELNKIVKDGKRQLSLS